MKSSMKKVLSLVLALAMIVIASVPAFAATGVVDPADPNDAEIKFCVTRGGLKSGVSADVRVTVGDAEVEELEVVNGEGVFMGDDDDFLDPNTVYVFELPVAQVEEDSPNKYAVRTNANGQVIEVRAIVEDADGNVVDERAVNFNMDDDCLFTFRLVNPGTTSPYTIYTRYLNGEAVEQDVPVSVYAVQTVDDEYRYGDDDAINQVDYDRVLGTNAYTVENGELELSAEQLAFARENYVTNGQAEGEDDSFLPIVALVNAGRDGEMNTEDDVVVFTNFHKDKQAVLTLRGTNDANAQDLRVIVRGLNNPTVAVPGATVEIQRNSTELFGPESFGEAVASGVTNANGEVVFEDVAVADLLRYLSDAAINDDDQDDDGYAEILLPFRATVTRADGYRVPESVVLTRSEIEDGEVIIDLTPSNAGQLVGRIAGDDRFETSVEVARELYGAPSEGNLGAFNKLPNLYVNRGADPSVDPLVGDRNIILANGMNFPDALAGNGLTSYYDAPILLTRPGSLDANVQEFIDDYDVENVIILGGETAVSGAIETALERQGLTTTRLFGANRYGTSEAIAERIAMFYGGELPMFDVNARNVDAEFQAFVTSGEDFADALVASVPAAIYGMPIILTNSASVPAATASVIDRYDISSAIVVGGPNAITDSTYANLNIATKERIYGENRQITSMRTAERFFPQAGSAFVAGGLRYPDALVGGALAAFKQAPILLTNSANLTPAVADYIEKHRITDVTILGGPNAVSNNVQSDLQATVLEASR